MTDRASDGRQGLAGLSVDSQVLVNVRQIAMLEEEQLHARSAGERLAGAVTRVAGTAVFAVAHLVWFASWILINSARVASSPERIRVLAPRLLEQSLKRG